MSVEYNKDNDKELLDALKEWKKKRDDKSYLFFKKSFTPSLNAILSKYTGASIPKKLIEDKLDNLLLQALDTWDPKKAGFNTHLWNTSQKLYRYVNANQNMAYIPEHKTLQLGAFVNAKSHLADKLGRTPNLREIADNMHISESDASKLEAALVDEMNIGDSGDFDVYTTKLDDPLQMYLYSEIPNEYKKLYEEMMGLSGKPATSNITELSKRLNVPYHTVRRQIQKLMSILEDLHDKYSRANTTVTK